MLLPQALARSLSPYRLMACFSVFFVIRVECDAAPDVGDLMNGGGATAGGPLLEDEVLLRSVLEEQRPLAARICGVVDACEAGEDAGDGDPPPPALVSEEDVSLEEGAGGVEDAAADHPLLGGAHVFSLARAPSANARCRRQSRIFLDELRSQRLWALQMWDAGAKLPSGLLRGNANQLGDFDECMAVDSGPLLAWGGERVRGSYCLAEVDVRLAQDAADADADARNAHSVLSAALDMVLSYRFIRSELEDRGHLVPKFTSINWALCVPAACAEADVQAGVGDALRRLGAGAGVRTAALVERGMCYAAAPEAASETGGALPPAAVAVIALYLFLALVTAVATMRDQDGRPPPRTAGRLERAVMAFSLRRNWAALVEPLPAEGDISCIHGIRALFSLCLYLAHKVITLALIPFVNRVELTQTANEPFSSVLRASVIYTDAFFMLSGVLVAYSLSKELQRKGSVKWTTRYVARYIRLTPALVALVLFYAYVFEHLGQGPLWGRVVQQNAEICKRNMWRNVLYIQNLYPFEDICAGHTHQLALDMQLFLLAPPLVTLLCKSPAAGAVVLMAINAVSTTVRYVSTRDNDLSFFIYHGIPMRQLYKTANMAYEIALCRATPYVTGIALGYFLSKTGKKVHIPKAAAASAWATAAVLGYYAMLSRWPEARRDFQYSASEAAVYAACAPVAWALALAWLIFACFTGNGGYLNTFLSSKPLVIFSRISYAIYLTQFAVFFYNVGVTRTPEQFTIMTAVHPAEFLVVVALSVLMTLIFDFPMQEIKTILLSTDSKSRSKVSGEIASKNCKKQ